MQRPGEEGREPEEQEEHERRGDVDRVPCRIADSTPSGTAMRYASSKLTSESHEYLSFEMSVGARGCGSCSTPRSRAQQVRPIAAKRVSRKRIRTDSSGVNVNSSWFVLPPRLPMRHDSGLARGLGRLPVPGIGVVLVGEPDASCGACTRRAAARRCPGSSSSATRWRATSLPRVVERLPRAHPRGHLRRGAAHVVRRHDERADVVLRRATGACSGGSGLSRWNCSRNGLSADGSHGSSPLLAGSSLLAPGRPVPR